MWDLSLFYFTHVLLILNCAVCTHRFRRTWTEVKSAVDRNKCKSWKKSEKHLKFHGMRLLCAFVSELLEVAKWFATIARSERERENTIDVCAVRLCEASNYFQFWFHFDCNARNLIGWIGFFHLLLIAHTVILFLSPPSSLSPPPLSHLCLAWNVLILSALG